MAMSLKVRYVSELIETLNGQQPKRRESVA